MFTNIIAAMNIHIYLMRNESVSSILMNIFDWSQAQTQRANEEPIIYFEMVLWAPENKIKQKISKATFGRTSYHKACQKWTEALEEFDWIVIQGMVQGFTLTTVQSGTVFSIQVHRVTIQISYFKRNLS